MNILSIVAAVIVIGLLIEIGLLGLVGMAILIRKSFEMLKRIHNYEAQLEKL